MFTVLNAAIHFAFAFTISRLKLASQDLIYLLSALVLTFSTIAIPVQLDGNWVTLLWTTEAAILFWLGRAKHIPLYEIYSYPLMCLAALSLLHDGQTASFSRAASELATNQFRFSTAILSRRFFLPPLCFIFYTNKDERFETAVDESLRQPFGLRRRLSRSAFFTTLSEWKSPIIFIFKA